MTVEYFEVFARRKADEPLLHVGTVQAADPDDAEVFAVKLYDQWRWSEQFIAPRGAFIEVVRPD